MLKIADLLRRGRRDRRGFTLVELLVVVAILGILAAIAVPRVTENIRAARVGADIANERMILNALDAFFLGMTPAGPRLRYPENLSVTEFVYEHLGTMPALPAGLPDTGATGTLAAPSFRPYANRYVVNTARTEFTWTHPDGRTTTR